MNKVILMGRLTRDPEIRYSQSAEPVAVARYGVAVNRRFKRDNEPDADFIDCVVFGKSAEFAERFFKKGMMVAISGRLQVSTWEDQQGQKRWRTEVVVEDQEFAESKAAFEARQQAGGHAPSAPAPQQKRDDFSAIAEPIDDDDLPF